MSTEPTAQAAGERQPDLDAVRAEARILADAVAYGELDSRAVPDAIGRLAGLLGVTVPIVPDEYFETPRCRLSGCREATADWKDYCSEDHRDRDRSTAWGAVFGSVVADMQDGAR